MHYNVQYGDLGSQETVKKALADCKGWMGARRFKKLCASLAEDRGRSHPRMVRIGLSIVGIQGYPATVLMDTYWTRQRDLFDAE